MRILETWLEVDGSKRYEIGNSGWYEAFSNNEGELFKSMQKAYGRCTSKIYVDISVAFYPPRTVPIGWVFVKRERYEDSEETVLKETWVRYEAA